MRTIAEGQDLPYVDEHAVVIRAGIDHVWTALTALDRVFSRPRAALYARAVGCTELEATGPRPLAEGSTMPGFRVVTAVPRAELGLAGRHRFSSYALTFHIDPISKNRTRLRAETRAVFPGVLGRTYRGLVIATGGHALVVRRLLSGVKGAAEGRHAAGSGP